MSILLCIPWLIRNVILSGYLVYPIYQIDLFSFDWKLPQEVAIKAKDYIRFVPYEYLNFLIKHPEYRYRSPLFINILTLAIYVLTILSTFFFFYKCFRQGKKMPFSYFFLGAVVVSTIIIWILNGPDIRFIQAIACVFIAFMIIIGGGRGDKSIYYPRFTLVTVVCLFFTYITIWTVRRSYYNYQTVSAHKVESVPRPYSSILIKPYTRECISQIVNPDMDKLFVPHELNNGIVIYISYADVTLERLPSTVNKHRGKFTDYKCLEARGINLQDGFKLKEECKSKD
ncbi:hypothetical protein JGH11_10010 [Dysgonomonas sp. Marseille-P4677]|nr:hypothetical protein [Dysgonomonas sp. Marseille-P4677]